MSWKIIADYRAWSGFYLDGHLIANGNFTPAQLIEIKKRGYTLVDSNEPPPPHLDLIQSTARQLSPEQLDNEWAKRAEIPDPMAMIPPSPPPPPKSPLDPEAVKAAAIAGKG